MTKSHSSGNRRRGFILTNHLSGLLTVPGGKKDEFFALRREGWRILCIRPICSSMERKIHGLDQLDSPGHGYRYSLCILEEPDRSAPHSSV